MGRAAIRVLAFLLGLWAGLLAAPGDSLAGGRVALVIGNSAYKYAPPLNNPVNDATDIAEALERLGFDVIRGLDLDYAGMREQVLRFSDRLSDADVGLFFYAGHGLQVGGRNFLLPVDTRLETEADLDFRTIDLDLLLRNMTYESRTNIVFLDACRDHPLANYLARRKSTRSAQISRGLAQVKVGGELFIAFATEPGSVALDGDGRNSPFTRALLDNIERPGTPIQDMMMAVRNQVIEKTNHQQVPWDHTSLRRAFFFVPQSQGAVAPEFAKAAPKEVNPLDLEREFWNSIKNSKNPRLFEVYLKRYPDGAFADLAKINLEEFDASARHPPPSPPPPPDDKAVITDAGLLREIRDRLYELNFDPGPLDGPMGEPALSAIREFQSLNKVEPADGQPTNGLLRRLRELGGVRPWGSIVFAKSSDKWGMAWGHSSRKEAVASARASCPQPNKCTTEVSFYGTECGAFAHAGAAGAYALVSREDAQQARNTALSDCRNRGKGCRIVAAVCADGGNRSQ